MGLSLASTNGAIARRAKRRSSHLSQSTTPTIRGGNKKIQARIGKAPAR